MPADLGFLPGSTLARRGSTDTSLSRNGSADLRLDGKIIVIPA
jgi:hypothetical protein